MSKTEYDAIVVGSGPNGLAAAITLRQEGLNVLLVEGYSETGGGTRTAGLTLPGFRHDICAAIVPMAALSPFFKELPLALYGLDYLKPEVSAAHPLDDGSAGVLYTSLSETAEALGRDAGAYRRFMEPVIRSFPNLMPGLLSAFPPLKHPFELAAFGIKALPPADWTVRRFQTPQARALWGGMAAHAIQPLEKWITSAIGLMLMAASHVDGWPLVKGGTQQLAKALTAYYLELGGQLQTNFYVKSVKELPTARAILFDVTPKQLLRVAGGELPGLYAQRIKRYRYGMGVFKIDWALSEPVPFRSPACRRAGTVHLGGTFEEIAAGERQTAEGKYPERPFVLFSQPTLFDPSRAPEGKHVAWAYCHVPHGAETDRTAVIENQVERFAPGFRDTVLARHTFTAREMEAYNPNYVGGDINGGVQDIFQHFSRPVLSVSPYRTPRKGLYLCSSSTPPGGGVHGMCGYHAARQALRDLF